MLISGLTLNVLLPTAGALVGSVIGAITSLGASLRSFRLDRSKLISMWSRSEEIEKARIAAYRELWQCLGGISTHNGGEMVANLPTVQERLQNWYYDGGGGLFLTGSAQNSASTKATFFVARDLRSNDPYEIWRVFHGLRQSVRRDLGVFESDEDEVAALESVKKKLAAYGK